MNSCLTAHPGPHMPCFADTSNHSSSLCSSPQEGELEAVSCSFASSYHPAWLPRFIWSKASAPGGPSTRRCVHRAAASQALSSPESRELASEQRFLINSTTSFTQPDLTWFGHRSLTLHGQLTVSRETRRQCVPETSTPTWCPSVALSSGGWHPGGLLYGPDTTPRQRVLLGCLDGGASCFPGPMVHVTLVLMK